ncbi:hypothetical protein BDV96DRAFT_28684 [Lophiotrema nucula]|uniref:Uncharacterized protein n=1 Tax=Lophiotrema nucula TaxID=690887 RepID=A0A6A5ZDP6_9PLEO|nr:hypothetical protein BDV96DRAFT_28684 [Lophiotrema nucula]
MLATTVLALAFAAAGLAQTVPAGYRKVYMTSNVDTKFIVVPKTPVKNGTTTVVQTNTNKPGDTWFIAGTAGKTKIYLSNTTLCMDAGVKTAWKDMANIYVNECSDTAVGQNWVDMGDGRIQVDGSSPAECIDLQYMRATANNPVGLYACAGLGNTGAKDKGINWPLVNVTAF